ncbi:hypothetical protein Ancab_016873 [Ancistrocladus abbreviatus]
MIHVQDGLDLCRNYWKKKDKKGFENALRIATRIGLSIKEMSKHDLNMIVGNYLHQSLVLDASPLEMINIKDLDPVPAEANEGLLWAALDELMSEASASSLELMEIRSCKNVMQFLTSSANIRWRVIGDSVSSRALPCMRYCPVLPQFLFWAARELG